MKLNKGILITIEGVDTVGKSTRCKKLSENLYKLGIDNNIIHFPNYNSPTGKLILDVLNGRKHIKDFKYLQYIYAIDQKCMEDEINTLLERGNIVICDRYSLSSIIYTKAKQLFEVSKDIENFQDSINLLKPDIQFVMYYGNEEDLIKSIKSKVEKDDFENDISMMTLCNNAYKNYTSKKYNTINIKKNNIYGLDKSKLSYEEIDDFILNTINKSWC